MRVDYVSDLHLDNAMYGGPQGWVGKVLDFSDIKIPGADGLIVAGDTAQHIDDTIDLLNAAKDHYDFVIAVLGNHERGVNTKTLARGVTILDNIPGHALAMNDTLFVGSCLLRDDPKIQTIKDGVQCGWHDNMNVVIISHCVPVKTLKEITSLYHQDLKCNDLINILGEAQKPTTIIFGHLHLTIDTYIDGYHLLSNPRGYRRCLRDGTYWHGLRQLEV